MNTRPNPTEARVRTVEATPAACAIGQATCVE